MLTDTHTETARVLAVMLKENTGAHFLDSGGTPHRDERGRYAASRHGYGRHWERNRRRDFETEPAMLVSFRYGIELTHNVYHWLLERVRCDAGMQALFDEFVDGRDDTYWLQDMEEFPAWLRDRGHEVTGLYGDGEPFTVNTYNHDSLLSQVLQFLYFEVSEPGARWGQAYVLLQVHGGCRATAPTSSATPTPRTVTTVSSLSTNPACAAYAPTIVASATCTFRLRNGPEQPDAAKAGCGAASPAGWVRDREADELPPFFGRRDRGIESAGFGVQAVGPVCDRCSLWPCGRVASLRTLSAMSGKCSSKKVQPAKRAASPRRAARPSALLDTRIIYCRAWLIAKTKRKVAQ